MDPTRVTIDEIRVRMERGEPFTFIDSRNAKAWGESNVKISGALRVPAEDVGKHLPEISKDRVVIVYCT